MSPRSYVPTFAVVGILGVLAGCPAPVIPEEPEQRRSVRPSAPTERSSTQIWLATSPTPPPSGLLLPPSPAWTAAPEPGTSSEPIGGPAASCDMAATVASLVVEGDLVKPAGAAIDADGHLWLSLYDTHEVVEIVPEGGCRWRVARRVGGSSAALNDPRGLAFDVARRWLYVADYANHRIRRIDTQAATLALETYAGEGIGGFTDGPAREAWFHYPAGVAVDRAGVVYVADSYNHRIRRIAAESYGAGAVTTLMGGEQGSGLGRFNRPAGVAVEIEPVNPNASPGPTPVPGASDAATPFIPTVYVADTLNHRVVRLTPPMSSPGESPGTGGATGVTGGGTTSVFGPGASDWTASVIAGEAGEQSFADGLPTKSRLAGPTTVLYDQGALWVSDTGNHAVRRIGSPRDAKPILSTFAGSGGSGLVDGALTQATFRYPQGLARGPRGELFVADTDNGRVRSVRGNQEAP